MYIYKIYCNDIRNVTKFYIGSTINLYKRMAMHKHNSQHSNLPLYCYIRDNGGWYNFNFSILCYCDKFELKKIERYFFDFYNSSLLNIRKPYSSEKEKQIYYKQYTSLYNQQNKEYYKTYYLNNKEKYNRNK